MIVSFVITAIVLLLAYISYDKYQKEQRLKWIKIPKGLPILGHALDFKSSISKCEKDAISIFRHFLRFSSTPSDVWAVFQGNQLRYVRPVHFESLFHCGAGLRFPGIRDELIENHKQVTGL